MRAYGIPKEKITVIYEGVSPRFRPADPETVRAIRAKYGLPEHFILYVGTIESRKNLATLYEGFGLPVLEATACGVPVVGSDSGAIPEVVGDAGLIFPEGDVEGLVERLQSLIESPRLYQQLTGRGYQRVVGFYRSEAVAEQTADFYQRLFGAVF